MNTSESISWLKENSLYDKAKKISEDLKNVYSSSLGVIDEKIVIIGDTGFADKNISSLMSGAYYLAAEKLRLDAKLIMQTPKQSNDPAHEDVANGLKDLDNGSVIIVSLSNKLGHLENIKSFRKMCHKNKHRFLSSLSLGDIKNDKVDRIMKAINVSYKSLQMRDEIIQKQLNKGSEAHITTKAGTDLHFNIKSMKAVSANGNYKEPGSGGNLPAGEVYIPPNGKRVEGKVVIDGSSRNNKGTTLIKDPISLKVENGSITDIEGGKEAKELQKTLDDASDRAKHPSSLRRIGELGIGINPNASIIGATIIDEKTLGTAHVAIGSNYWFGGDIYAIVHLDQIFKDPAIKIDGKLLNI